MRNRFPLDPDKVEYKFVEDEEKVIVSTNQISGWRGQTASRVWIKLSPTSMVREDILSKLTEPYS